MKPTFVLLLFLASITNVYAQASVVVLGVTHSLQLASSKHSPAVLRQFVDCVKPSMICIERSPSEFSRNDFYEFTYEQQFCLVPYAIEKGVLIQPIDWIPDTRDLIATMGTDNYEYPDFTRRKQGFQGFMWFDSIALARNFFYAEQAESKAAIEPWYTSHPGSLAHYDFSRRFFIYRTFMQAVAIKDAATRMKGTIVVVVGSYHKYDIEHILRGYGINVINSEQYNICIDEVNVEMTIPDAFAVASFNLLGLQSRLSQIDYAYVGKAVRKIESLKSNEAKFFSILWRNIVEKGKTAKTISQLEALLENVRDEEVFTWTGVKNESRVDSYFDPFGNLRLRQRVMLELARCHYSIGNVKAYQKQLSDLRQTLSGLKLALFSEYVRIYVEGG